MIDGASLESLRRRGLQRGFLTTSDLREALPIHQMDADEIALLVVRLEEAGINVELEDDLDDLIGSSRRRATTPQEPSSVDLPGAPPSRLDATRPAQAPGVTQDAYAAGGQVTETAPANSRGWIFVAAAGAVIALGAAVLFALGR